MSHLVNANKMVGETPRTDHQNHKLLNADSYTSWLEMSGFARQLERELNAANAIIRQQQLLDEENLRLKDRIKRLEEGGGLALGYASKGDFESADEVWRKAKEAKP